MAQQTVSLSSWAKWDSGELHFWERTDKNWRCFITKCGKPDNGEYRIMLNHVSTKAWQGWRTVKHTYRHSLGAAMRFYEDVIKRERTLTDEEIDDIQYELRDLFDVLDHKPVINRKAVMDFDDWGELV